MYRSKIDGLYQNVLAQNKTKFNKIQNLQSLKKSKYLNFYVSEKISLYIYTSQNVRV